LLGLRPIEDGHTGKNIVERVSMVVDGYGLTDKIFANTLDNASSNKTSMSYIITLFSSYLGLSEYELYDAHNTSSIILHQRCTCHIINLIVKSGLKWLHT
jgi:hypothetical protein